MIVKKIEKKVYLPNHGVSLDIDLSIPLYYVDTVDEKVDEHATDLIVNQITRGVKSSLESYRNNGLPTNFTRGQNIVTTTDLDSDTYGVFDQRTDTIYVDPDSISTTLRSFSPAFILGHLVGCKIAKYRDTKEIYDQIADFFGISRYNNILVGQIYSDIVGNIAANGYSETPDWSASDELVYHAEEVLTPGESSFIKKRVLHSIYKG